jgi:hypothetical protein
MFCEGNGAAVVAKEPRIKSSKLGADHNSPLHFLYEPASHQKRN